MTLRPRYVGKNLLIPGKLGSGKTLDAQDGLESASHQQIIRGKDLWLDKDSAVLQHHNLTFEHCRMVFRDTTALSLFASHGLRLRWVQIIHASPPNTLDTFPQAGPFTTLDEYRTSQKPPPVTGAGGFGYDAALWPDNIPDNAMQLAILVNDCEDIDMLGVQIIDASSGIVTFDSANIKVRKLEVIRPRGPFYRGQGLQFARSENCTLEDFHVHSPLNDSFPEDSISCYYSTNCTIKRGLINGNNAPLGVGVMLESSSYCHVEDVDAIDMGNGAFSSYGYYDAGNDVEPVYGHDNTFLRCRARDGHYMTKRGNPASGCFFQALSGTYNVEFIDCSWYAPAPEAGASPFEPDVTMPIEGVYLRQNGDNVVTRAEFTEIDFVARTPGVFTYPWEDYKGGPYATALNVGPAQFKPDIDETTGDAVFVGELRSFSADPAETFTYAFTGGYNRFEIYDTNKVRTNAAYDWDELSTETLPVRTTGSRGQTLDRNLPVTINPINEVGEATITGWVAGDIDGAGALPTAWAHEKTSNITVTVIEEELIFPVWGIWVQIEAAPSVVEESVSFYAGGLPGAAAVDGETWMVRGYMIRSDPLTLDNTALALLEMDAAVTINSHIDGGQLNEDLFNEFSKFQIEAELVGGVNVDGAACQAYFAFDAEATTRTQTVFLGALRLLDRN